MYMHGLYLQRAARTTHEHKISQYNMLEATVIIIIIMTQAMCCLPNKPNLPNYPTCPTYLRLPILQICPPWALGLISQGNPAAS